MSSYALAMEVGLGWQGPHCLPVLPTFPTLCNVQFLALRNPLNLLP